MSATLAEQLRSSAANSQRHTGPETGLAKPLQAVLDDLLKAVEGECGGDIHASILLLEDGRLLHGAAPSLPEAYNSAIHGIEIGPSVGSCGTAAYLGHPVYVTDIASDPLWKDFKDLAEEHGLRACWSTPIEGPDRSILGTFAIYHRTPRSPNLDEVDAIRLISGSVALAIIRYRELGAPTAGG